MLHAKVKQAFFKARENGQAVMPDRQTAKLTLLRYSICTVMGYLFTRMTLLGILNGFGLAFAAALPLPYAVGGWIGCAIGGIFEGLNSDTIFYLTALFLWIAAKRWLMISAIPKHYIGLFWQSAAFGVLLAGRALVLYFAADLALMEFVMLLLAAAVQILVFLSTNIFGSAFFYGSALADYSKAQGLAAVVLGVLSVSALGRYQFGSLPLAGIVSTAAATVFAYRFGCVGGAVSGVLAGLGMLLYDTDRIEFAGLLLFGAFLAGLTARRSKLTAAVSMMVCHYALVLIYGKPLQMLPLSICTMLGVMLFVCLPESILEGVSLPDVLLAHGPPDKDGAISRQYEEQMQVRMMFAADAVDMLGQSVNELADILKKEVRPDAEQVYAAVENRLCRRCKRRFSCYGADYDRVRASFDGLNEMLRDRMQIKTERFPQFLKENCIRPEDLIRVFTAAYQQLCFASEQQRQLNRSRTLVLEQFSAAAQLLKELGEGQHLIPDREAQTLLMEQLSKEGYAPMRICCGSNESGFRFIDLYYGEKIPPAGELKELIEKYLGILLDAPVIADAKSMTKITFYEPPPFGVKTAMSQKAANRRVSGDTVTTFCDGRGSFYLLLSDGMGRGKRAALDSMTVCTILSKLIGAGFGWQAALKLLNTALMVKSTEETLATVDIVRVDLYRGEAEFVKAGAASSFWANEKSVSRIRSFTLPIGIVSGISFDSKTVQLAPGDTLLLCSDGIGDDEGWIAKKLVQNKGQPLQTLTDSICEEALSRCKENPDDMTAAAVCLVQYKEAVGEREKTA